MNERKTLVWAWTLIVIVVCFILWLAWTDRAEPHITLHERMSVTSISRY